VERVHGASARAHRTSVNVSHSSGNLCLGLNEPKGYPALLILAVDAGMDGPQRLGWQARCDCGGALGPQRQLTRVGF
jgi:hypothetical protein